jgi:O-antigen/teichoic acid export membrane protein
MRHFVDNFQEIKERSIGAIGPLLIRQVLTKLIFFVANIALARLLVPKIFGVYAIVSFIVQFFSIFGEVGLGAALIQRKDQLEEFELSSIFWFQQAVAWCMAIILMLAAPLLVTFYPSLPSVGVWLVRAMAVSLVVSSLKSVSVLQLERNLDFRRIAYIDIIESISFHAVAVGFAFAGCGVWSFVIAAICRSVASVVVVFSCSQWRPGFEFDFAAVRQLLRFGIPYQGNNVLGFLKDAVTPIFVGVYAGASAVGFLDWAKNFAFAPLMLSGAFGRVAFPTFSRIQEYRESLARTVERSIRMLTLIMFPITAVMLAAAPELIQLVYTEKWLPALPAFYFFCTSPMVIGIVLPMYSAILSLGNSKVLLWMTVLLLLLEWGIGIPAVLYAGFNGISFSQPIIALIFFYIYRAVLLRERVVVATFKNIRYQAVAAGATGVLLKLCIAVLQPGTFMLVALLLLTPLAYPAILLVVQPKLLKELLEYLTLCVGNRGMSS